MAETIPYLAAPGTIRRAFEKISDAATPERVTGDFVQTVLGIKGGQGGALVPFLKKIGMVAPDGTPTDLYKKYRNKTTGKAAIATAIKYGYKKLAEANEYFYKLNDEDLKALLVQVTGNAKDSSVVSQVFGTLKQLKSFADFETVPEEKPKPLISPPVPLAEIPLNAPRADSKGLGLNLSYTINLNLPATSDQAVFNAIFRSLKEFLITDAKG